MADAGSIGRTAQVSYEAGQSFPDVHYLTLIQSTGVDMAYILGGSDLKTLSKQQELDWEVASIAIEEVDAFLLALKEKCDHDTRMKFSKQFYDILQKNRSTDEKIRCC